MKIWTENYDAMFPDNEINYCASLKKIIKSQETNLLLDPFVSLWRKKTKIGFVCWFTCKHKE